MSQDHALENYYVTILVFLRIPLVLFCSDVLKCAGHDMSDLFIATK